MEKVNLVTSRTIVLPVENVDTDHIIPARFLKATSKIGLGQHLFADWRFDGAGVCTNIPYSQRTNKKAHLRTYPVVVRNGFVMAWYHPGEEAPQWDIPVLPEHEDPAFTDYFRSSYVIRTVPQEMSENGADPAHFQFVHGTDTVAEMEEYNTDGPCSAMLSKQSYVTPRGTTWGRAIYHKAGNLAPGMVQPRY